MIHADEIPSAIDKWPRYQILWQDHHERTVIRARTQLEAESIARKVRRDGELGRMACAAVGNTWAREPSA